MKRFKSLVATLFAILIFCPGEVSLANTGGLDALEAESLSYLREFAKYKKDIYESTLWSCTWATDDANCEPTFTALVAEQRRHMDILKDLLDHYGVDDPVVNEDGHEYSEGFLDDDLNFRMFVGWMPSYVFIVENVAYLEELNIRDLRQAYLETDEQLLLDSYTELLYDDFIHLLQLASTLHDDALDYEAQLLVPTLVHQVLLHAMALESGFTINSGLNDSWYDPATDGQGFTITVYEDTGTIFLTWLTYDTELPGQDANANLGDAGQRWLTAQGAYEGTQAELVVYSSSGGLFDRAQPVPELESVGSILLQFDDCYTGMVTYDLPKIDRSGSIPIKRVATDNVCNCVDERYVFP